MRVWLCYVCVLGMFQGKMWLCCNLGNSSGPPFRSLPAVEAEGLFMIFLEAANKSCSRLIKKRVCLIKLPALTTI